MAIIVQGVTRERFIPVSKGVDIPTHPTPNKSSERRLFLGPDSPTPQLGPFPPEVLAEAEGIVLDDEFFRDREEVKGITIDPVGAKDLDDAIYVEQDGNGFRVSVTIADPSSVIHTGSLLDEVANARAFTRYYGEMGNEPMLPSVLSEDRLSLHEGQRRPTVTIFMPIDGKLNLGKPEVKRTFLRSRRAFSYAEADRIIFENNDPDAQVLRMAYGLARRLEHARGTDYNFAKNTEISEEGEEKQMRWGDAYRSMILVKGLMVRGNMGAGLIARELDIPVLYRGHDTIGERAYYSTVFAGHEGMRLRSDEPYAHFTSPLRRLSDLIFHRQLLTALEGRQPPYTQDELDQVASSINNSINVHRDNVDGGRAAYVKEIMNALARKALQEGKIEDLDEIPPRRVVRVAVQDRKLYLIEPWLLGRLKEDERRESPSVTSKDVVPILFSRSNDRVTRRLIEKLVTRYPGFAREIVESFCAERGISLAITQVPSKANSSEPRKASITLAKDGWERRASVKGTNRRKINKALVYKAREILLSHPSSQDLLY